jgi:hypothetical protein
MAESMLTANNNIISNNVHFLKEGGNNENKGRLGMHTSPAQTRQNESANSSRKGHQQKK